MLTLMGTLGRGVYARWGAEFMHAEALGLCTLGRWGCARGGAGVVHAGARGLFTRRRGGYSRWGAGDFKIQHSALFLML